MTLTELWKAAPLLDRALIALLVVLDAAGLVVTVLLVGVQRGDWAAVLVLCPLLVAMAVTHLLFYRWQVTRPVRARHAGSPRKWTSADELLGEIVDRAQRPAPRLPSPFRRRRVW